MELQHHGIKGQRWGVRRYQNPDGSLTANGYLHYGYGKKQTLGKNDVYRVTSKGIDRFIDNNGELSSQGKKILKNTKLVDNIPEFADGKTKEQLKKEAGVFKKGKDEYVKKGTYVYRLANGDEPIDSRRKYVYLTEDDKRQYGSMTEFFDVAGNLHRDTYELKNDIKIAPIESTMDFILRDYKNVKVKDLNLKNGKDEIYDKIIDKIKDRTIESVRKEYENNYKGKTVNLDDEFSGSINKQIETNFTSNYYRALSDVVNTTLSKIDDVAMDSEITKHYSKLGYDAITDPNDGYEFATYPLILLNPEKSVKRIRHENQFM